jgi:hypothetical protein
MKMLFFVLAFFSASAFADDWQTYNQTSDHNNQFKKGSLIVDKNQASLLMRSVNKTKNEILFFNLKINSSDCKKGHGVVSYFHTNGQLFKNFDYVEKGGTVVSEWGDLLCFAFFQQNPG